MSAKSTASISSFNFFYSYTRKICSGLKVTTYFASHTLYDIIEISGKTLEMDMIIKKI